MKRVYETTDADEAALAFMADRENALRGGDVKPLSPDDYFARMVRGAFSAWSMQVLQAQSDMQRQQFTQADEPARAALIAEAVKMCSEKK